MTKQMTDISEQMNSLVTALGKRLNAEIQRREELETVAAALYLGHDDAKDQFDIYKAVYLAAHKETQR